MDFLMMNYSLKEKPEIVYELGKEALKAEDFVNA